MAVEGNSFGRSPSARIQVGADSVEKFVMAVLRDIATSVAAGPQAAPSAVLLSDPCHFLVLEGGEFCASTERQHRVVVEPRNYPRLARLFGALDMVHRLKVARRTATQRELFYRATADAPSLFRSQPHMDKALRDVVGALRVGRPHLGVLTSEKGIIAGDVSFRNHRTSTVSRAASGGIGAAITEFMLSDDCTMEVGVAHCVLVVEKDTFFQLLLQGRLRATLPLILVTGRGFPDLLTRRLLQRLHRVAPNVPQVYLGDYDPHGAAIFFVYLASCPSLRWLGMHQSDVKDLPAAAALPLTGRDNVLLTSLLGRPVVRNNERYVAELTRMDRKFELEALHSTLGAEEISRRFIPEKILRHEWI